jgi:dTDP-4-dehydrorhamnose reductase
MKIIITGASGQLGQELVQMLQANKEYRIFPFTRKELDITNRDQINRIFEEVKPDITINCAAFTNVDLCETELEQAYLINGLGPYYLGMAAKRLKAKLIHISTDYVFSGEQQLPYTEEDTPNPLTIYGKSKLLGEELLRRSYDNILIVRTSWLYGHNGHNFVRTMLTIADKRSSINVVDDQIGTPSYTFDVSRAILLLMKDKTGIYHVTNEGQCSWYDFAKEIMIQIKSTTVVNAISSEEYVFKTPRPSYSVLSKQKLKLEEFNSRDWKSGLFAFLAKENNETS